MQHRLHNMVWGSQNPNWLLAIKDAATLIDVMGAHIAGVLGPLANVSYAVDVVNEAVADGGAELYKPSPPWYPAVPDYVERAFRLADATRKASANPAVKLFYNEYGAEGSGAKSDKVYGMLKDFVSRGVPVDGVGLQMHISVDGSPSEAELSANIARLVALGLEVHVTEMDVRCVPPCGADRLATQATIYAGVVKACKDNSAATAPSGKGGCKSVETWGLTDRHTWITDFDNPNHVDEKPLQFDVNYNKKPCFASQLAAFNA